MFLILENKVSKVIPNKYNRDVKYISQANHGGVKGKLPSSVVNQDPTMSSQNKTKVHGSGDESQAESDDEEEDRPSTPDQEELNKSDDEDNTVSTKNSHCYQWSICLWLQILGKYWIYKT